MVLKWFKLIRFKMLILKHHLTSEKIVCVDKLEITDPILGEELISSLTRLADVVAELKPKVKRLLQPTRILIFEDRIYLHTTSLIIGTRMKDFSEVKSHIDDWILASYRAKE